ncbi:MAG: hypothetical protein DME71_11960 [Verrucomicrobia bacterium]|nr:MAG: hypothetical protein DME71_11960 [Verrucomicrobiota bacterium]
MSDANLIRKCRHKILAFDTNALQKRRFVTGEYFHFFFCPVSAGTSQTNLFPIIFDSSASLVLT